jgi:hypothetical protein
VGLAWRLCGSDVPLDGGALDGGVLDGGLGAGGVSVAVIRAGRGGLAGAAGEPVGAAGELVVRFGAG